MENRNKSVLDRFFILSLFLVLMVTGVFTVVFGAMIYEKAENTMECNYELRTANLYIRNKISAFDYTDGIQVEDNLLILSSQSGNSKTKTYLYLKDGYLQEMTALESFEFNYQDGAKIMAVDSFVIEKTSDNMLHFYVVGEEIATDFYVSVYSSIG
ncbi:MAG: DUF4860 domain-containing protein [Lachnospiraceae bacterium]|nr:DUF4860 domain-containing protein [Lachnospiraceae bacterium]